MVAGAGTGKTSVITERINLLLSKGTPPNSILALTFTEKAASEMIDRLGDVVGFMPEMPVMTFNAYGESLLRKYGTDIGLNRNFKVMGESAQLIFLRDRLDQLKLDYFSPISMPDGLLSDLSNYFSTLKQNVITPEEYISYATKLTEKDEAEKLDKTKHLELAFAYKTYIELSRESNLIDYDDQIYLVIELLRKRPNILKEIASGYEYVMVDEYQDTNTMQSLVVDMVSSAKSNVFVVGDDDQSIYGWRGATLANILNFKSRYPEAEEITLTENYRSSQEILDSAYNLIQNNNPYRLEAKLKINKKLKAQKHGRTPEIYSFKMHEEELYWIANDIKQRIASGTEPNDIAVLARRNSTIKKLSGYLENASVEHIVIGQRYELYREPIVRIILEAIKTVVDPNDNTSLFHTLTGPLFNIPMQRMSRFSAAAKNEHQNLEEFILLIDDQESENIKIALQNIKIWRDKAAILTVGQLAYEILSDSGYKDYLYNAALKDHSSALAVSRLAELFGNFKEFENIALQPSAMAYIEALPALQAAGDSNEDDSMDLSNKMVSLLSVHKSKGLEWQVVYIVDCSEGSFPLKNIATNIKLPEKLMANKTSEADLAMYEERRLMYVAMTRAKDTLILTYAEHHSMASTRKPSRFLIEAFGPEAIVAKSNDGVFEINALSATSVSTNNSPIPKNILVNDSVVLSVSQISKYLECPLDFYYKYILNVPSPPNAALEYGNILHGLLEEINNSLILGKLIELKELQRILKETWPRVGFLSARQRDRSFIQAENTIKNVYKRITTEPIIPLASEKPFKVLLDDIKLTIKGRFDAVFPYGDGVEIVDYKTSTQVDNIDKAKRRANSSEQLTLYALAWQKMEGDIPELLTLDFIDTGVKGSVKKTQRGIDGAYSRLQKVADGIRAADFTPGKDHRYCQHPK